MGNSIYSKLQLKLYEPTQNDTLLKYIERADGYFELCSLNHSNTKARGNDVYYKITKILPNEFHYASSFIESVLSIIPIRLINDLQTVYIVQLMPSSDGGMPHTRPLSHNEDVICFSDIKQLYSISTLIHELWHIHQRHYSMLWEKVFNNQGWRKWDGNLPYKLSLLEPNRRYNPDTIDCPIWIFQETWIPFPVFRDITHPKITEVDVWFYCLKDNTLTKNVPYELKEYYSESISSVAYEHPRELAAYLLSEPNKYENVPAFKDLVSELGAISIITKKN